MQPASQWLTPCHPTVTGKPGCQHLPTALPCSASYTLSAPLLICNQQRCSPAHLLLDFCPAALPTLSPARTLSPTQSVPSTTGQTAARPPAAALCRRWPVSQNLGGVWSTVWLCLVLLGPGVLETPTPAAHRYLVLSTTPSTKHQQLRSCSLSCGFVRQSPAGRVHASSTHALTSA